MCIWTRGVDDITLPVANAEGRFKTSDDICARLFQEELVVFQYADMSTGLATMEFPYNPNSSMRSIAAICDPSGRIFGLMPHPERYSSPENHYLASLQKILAKDYVNADDPAVARQIEKAGKVAEVSPGIQIFKNGVNYVKR